jgi:hypothetical protein
MSDSEGISTETEAPSVLDDTPMSAGASPAPAQSIAPGTLIGRYVILAKLGAGGMGIVLAAYDPELDRKIALKLLRAQGQSSARTRLQREAQALAKLDHPNVVSVHDVGVHEGQLFLAMEFVAARLSMHGWPGASNRGRGKRCCEYSRRLVVGSPRRTSPGWCTATSSPKT